MLMIWDGLVGSKKIKTSGPHCNRTQEKDKDDVKMNEDIKSEARESRQEPDEDLVDEDILRGVLLDVSNMTRTRANTKY